MNESIQYIIDNIEKFVFKGSPPNFAVNISKLDYKDYILIRNINHQLNEKIPEYQKQIVLDIIKQACYRRYINKVNFYKLNNKPNDSSKIISEFGNLQDFQNSFLNWLNNIDNIYN